MGVTFGFERIHRVLTQNPRHGNGYGTGGGRDRGRRLSRGGSAASRVIRPLTDAAGRLRLCLRRAALCEPAHRPPGPGQPDTTLGDEEDAPTMICHCTAITETDIRRAVDRMRAADPDTLIIPEHRTAPSKSARIAAGILAALLQNGVACLLFAAFILKERTGDIAHAHGELIVVLDARADLLAAWCGWRLGQSMTGKKMARNRKP